MSTTHQRTRGVIPVRHALFSRDILIASGIGLMLLAGCQQPTEQPATKLGLAKPDRMTTAELARQLGLSVSQVDETFVKLKNNSNVVMIFTCADSKFYVNGRACGPVGRLERVGTVVYVEPELADRIKSCLIPEQAPSKVFTDSRKPVATQGTIVVDAGHGGKDPGAPSALGFKEKAINLSVARQLASILTEKGFHVVLTRDSDVFIEKEERAAVANRCNADLFVSIHADSSESRSLNGFTVYTARGAGSQSRWAAKAILEAMGRTGMDSNGVREADYVVLVQTNCPAVLVEVGYLSNSWEAGRLRDPYMQKRLAQAIADGVVRSMGK
jgi:N-acetylmuramoyl-L-alanine amidase